MAATAYAEKEAGYACTREGCTYTSPSLKSFRTHVLGHKKTIAYLHPGCTKVFAWPKELKKHELTHLARNHYPHKCDIEGCTYSATRAQHLKRHKKTHAGEEAPTKKRKFCCTFEGCDYVAAEPHNLKIHTRKHTGEARFKCPVIGCEFATPWQRPFDSHMSAHTATVQFRCKEEGCFYICSLEKSLTRHRRKEHVGGDGSASFRCAVHDCRERFATHAALARHMPLHREQQLHNCHQCGRTYMTETGLDAHKVICARDALCKKVKVRPYKCTVPGCGLSFTQTDHRDRHMLIHRGGSIVKKIKGIGVSYGKLVSVPELKSSDMCSSDGDEKNSMEEAVK